MILPDKLSFRPAELAGSIEKKLKETGETPTEYIRRLIAADLGEQVPERKYTVENLKQFATKKSKKKKKRKQ